MITQESTTRSGNMEAHTDKILTCAWPEREQYTAPLRRQAHDSIACTHIDSGASGADHAVTRDRRSIHPVEDRLVAAMEGIVNDYAGFVSDHGRLVHGHGSFVGDQ